jgi:hypothetical protein
MTAVSRSRVKIWVVPGDTAASTLVTTSPYSSSNTLGYISGEIKSYSKTGGENEVESDPVFGGFVDKEKPQSQFELAFEVVPSLEKAGLWEAMVYGVDTNTGVYSSAADLPKDRAVFLEATDGTTNFSGWGFNNCSVTVLDQEHNADDNMTQNLTLKFSPTSNDGVANFIFNSTTQDTSFTGITDLPAWTALDNN